MSSLSLIPPPSSVMGETLIVAVMGFLLWVLLSGDGRGSRGGEGGGSGGDAKVAREETCRRAVYSLIVCTSGKRRATRKYRERKSAHRSPHGRSARGTPRPHAAYTPHGVLEGNDRVHGDLAIVLRATKRRRLRDAPVHAWALCDIDRIARTSRRPRCSALH